MSHISATVSRPKLVASVISAGLTQARRGQMGFCLGWAELGWDSLVGIALFPLSLILESINFVSFIMVLGVELLN